MKGLLNSCVALFTFTFSVISTISCFSCQTTFSQQIVADKFVGQTNSKPTLVTGETKSQNEETGCLSAEYPERKSKYIVSFGVINSKATDIPKPEYPKAAAAAKISGEVVVSILVDEQGKVAWGRIKNGHPLLQTAVKKVVCQASFKPQTLSGKPIAINGIIVYKFVPF